MDVKIIFILSSLLCTVYTIDSSKCATKETCGACIQTPECGWCSDPNYDGNRCFVPSSVSKCDEKYFEDPDNLISFLENKDIRRSKYYDTPSGMMPQKVKLQVRIGTLYQLYMKYRLPDPPIDVYFLIDAKSMSIENRNNIIYLSETLTESLTNLTSNFRIGFGSFVDKVVAPFVDTNPKKLLEPCKECSSPYGFHHEISLSNNKWKFLATIRKFQKSGTISELNGGMDALMQVLSCHKEIGWRENSMKFIIFASSSGFHLAGDGEQAGINKTNDEQCHLSNGFYTMSSFIDYPSISQINKKVMDNQIRILFAVTENKLEEYQKLSNNIQDSTVIKLINDFSNIITLLKDTVKKSKRLPELKDNSTDLVNVKLISSKFNQEEDIIDYTIELKVNHCPKDRSNNLETIEFYAVGDYEKSIVELKAFCTCPCESPGDKFYEENSNHCSNSGTYKCGICECSVDSFGQHCECNILGLEKSDCLANNSSSVICSGRGQCVCGQCECEARNNPLEKIYGKHCECDNFSCERHESELCSGPTNGICECGVCKCLGGWVGPSCACSTASDSCIKPNDDQMCSGHGTCQYGECVCNEVSKIKYKGQFCEIVV